MPFRARPKFSDVHTNAFDRRQQPALLVLPAKSKPSATQTPSVARGYAFSRIRALELFASAFGLSGMYLGSTTLHGALCYIVAIRCLIACVCIRGLWGLLPLNLAQAVVIVVNLFRMF
jgi:hypothetical protein